MWRRDQLCLDPDRLPGSSTRQITMHFPAFGLQISKLYFFCNRLQKYFQYWKNGFIHFI